MMRALASMAVGFLHGGHKSVEKMRRLLGVQIKLVDPRTACSLVPAHKVVERQAGGVFLPQQVLQVRK